MHIVAFATCMTGDRHMYSEHSSGAIATGAFRLWKVLCSIGM